MLPFGNAVRIINIESQGVGTELFVLLFEIEFVEVGDFFRFFRRCCLIAASGQHKAAAHKSNGSQKANNEGCGFHYNRFIVNVG